MKKYCFEYVEKIVKNKANSLINVKYRKKVRELFGYLKKFSYLCKQKNRNNKTIKN